MPSKRHRIRPRQTANARKLRRESTVPEQLLWSQLRGKRLIGWKFRRQAAIADYVVDFYCPTSQLVIEIDGRSHDGRQAYDAQRTARLAACGLRVVRYTNDDVVRDLDAVVEDIVRHLNATRNP